MTFRALAFAVSFALMTTGFARAHSPLTSTIPADKAIVATAPDAITMVFGKSARLTRVTIAKNAEPAQNIDLAGQAKSGTQFMLDAVIDGVGTYTVEWRALSEDGHPIKGRFSFTVE